MVTINVFKNDSKYSSDTLKVYNIDSYRNAEAIVYKNTTNVLELYGSESKSAVVDEVVQTVNADNELVYRIKYFVDNKFAESEVSSDVSLIKNSGFVVELGDVIRFSVQDGIIKSLIVDFDANANVMSGNAASDAEFNTSESRLLQYQYGMIGALKGKNMLLAQPTVLYALKSEDFQWKNLRLTAVPTSNIILVNRRCTQDKTGVIQTDNVEVRRIEPYEVLTYENSGADTDFALIRQRYLEPAQMIIYRTVIH